MSEDGLPAVIKDQRRYTPGQATRDAGSGKALTQLVSAGWKSRWGTGNIRSLCFVSASFFQSFAIEEILLVRDAQVWQFATDSVLRRSKKGFLFPTHLVV